jgi:hypothetical protein
LSNAPNAIIYEWVTNQLLNHHNICLPAHILGLARAAIAGGTVVAANAGTAGQPPASGVLAPGVTVSVPPTGKALPPPNLTFAATPDAGTASLLQCLYPAAVKRDASGRPVDANGNIVAVDSAAYQKLQAWMARNKFQQGTAALLYSRANANLRATALKQVCNN